MLLHDDGIEERLLAQASEAAAIVQADIWEGDDSLWAEAGRHEEVDVEQYNNRGVKRRKGGFQLMPVKITRDYDATGVKWHVRNREVGCERENGFFELRDALVTHYDWARKHGKIRWFA